MKKPSPKSPLHKSNFEGYITNYAQSNNLAMSGEEWERALAAARRLDYTGARDAQMQLVPSQPSLVRRLVSRLRRRSPGEVRLTELDDIQTFLKRAPKAVAASVSQIHWGPLRNGFGTWVMAILRPGGQQTGSRPTPARLRDAPRWELLAARRLLNGRALFVRGHLLHDEPGGAGVDYNEGILTAASGGDFGANHANWVHRHLVEGILLWAYRNMHGAFGTPTITEIIYFVKADYNRPPREGTEELRQIAQAYWQTGRGISGREGAQSSDAEPTHQQVINELARNPQSPHLHDAMKAIAAKAGDNWQKVYRRMVENQKLWQFEDANVPLALHIRYSWVENGVLRGPWQETVSIILPTSLAAIFQN